MPSLRERERELRGTSLVDRCLCARLRETSTYPHTHTRTLSLPFSHTRTVELPTQLERVREEYRRRQHMYVSINTECMRIFETNNEGHPRSARSDSPRDPFIS